MNKKKSKFIFTCLILLILLVILGMHESKIIRNEKLLKKIYGEPIAEDGTINNAYFGIEIDGRDAKKTLVGINKAIEYASKNNIENIKLEKGTYIIDSQKDQKEYHYQEKGITLKSNIKLDLNGSTIKHIENNRKSYSLISIIAVDNVSITNGILEGDRINHNYNNGTTNEFGHGIDLAGSQNIDINNLEIKDMTGDGIYITNKQVNMKDYNSEKVKIQNCDIHDCRRQGISVIVADGVEIYNNEIHDINGTNPQSCIDLETGGKESKIEHVKIYNNKLYSSKTNIALQISKNVYEILIYNNEINGSIKTYNAENEINIYKNTINNGGIIGVLSKSNIEDEKYYVKKIRVEYNILKNSYISLGRLNNSIIGNNEIENGYISVENMNSAIYNNKIINSENNAKDYGICCRVNDDNSNIYKMFIKGNNISGNFKELERIENNERLQCVNDEEQLQDYLNNF